MPTWQRWVVGSAVGGLGLISLMTSSSSENSSYISDPPREEIMHCEDKYYCADMNSCDEAYFYMNNCGLSRLDGNSDGVPCETLCN